MSLLSAFRTEPGQLIYFFNTYDPYSIGRVTDLVYFRLDLKPNQVRPLRIFITQAIGSVFETSLEEAHSISVEVLPTGDDILFCFQYKIRSDLDRSDLETQVMQWSGLKEASASIRSPLNIMNTVVRFNASFSGTTLFAWTDHVAPQHGDPNIIPLSLTDPSEAFLQSGYDQQVRVDQAVQALSSDHFTGEDATTMASDSQTLASVKGSELGHTASFSGAGTGDADVDTKVVEVIVEKTISELQTDLVRMKEEVKTEKANRLVDGIVSKLTAERALIRTTLVELERKARQRENDLNIRERGWKQELQIRDRTLRARNTSLKVTKDQLTRLQEQLVEMKRRLESKDVELREKTDLANRSQAPSLEIIELRQSSERNHRQIEEYKKSNKTLNDKVSELESRLKKNALQVASHPGGEDRMDQLAKIANLLKKELDSSKMKIEEFEKERKRTNLELTRLQNQVKNLTPNKRAS